MLIYVYAIILCLIILTLIIFLPGGVKRTIREKFYGNYYAEDAVIRDTDVPNSEAAIEKCCENGIGVKLPVLLSADGTPFVSTYDDLSKEYSADIHINTSTADEITAAGPITLMRAIEIIDGRVPVLIELKSAQNNELLCRKTADIIIASNKENIGVVSFHTGMLAWFKHTEKRIYRGLISAPSRDFKMLSKTDAFIQGNVLNASACRPQLLIYRNKPIDKLVNISYKLGMPHGSFLLTDAAAAKDLEEDNDVIIIRGFMPENPHYKDLPEMETTQIELDQDDKKREKEERRQRQEELDRRVAEEKQKKLIEKGKISRVDKKSAYLFDEEEFGPRDTEYCEEISEKE